MDKNKTNFVFNVTTADHISHIQSLFACAIELMTIFEANEQHLRWMTL